MIYSLIKQQLEKSEPFVLILKALTIRSLKRLLKIGLPKKEVISLLQNIIKLLTVCN